VNLEKLANPFIFSIIAGKYTSFVYSVLNFLTILPICKAAYVRTIETGSEQNLNVIGIR
jgi:hypothetical protein